MDYFEQIGITQLIGFPSADAENLSDLVYGISPLSRVDSGFMSDCKDLLSPQSDWIGCINVVSYNATLL